MKLNFASNPKEAKLDISDILLRLVDNFFLYYIT